MIKKGAVLYGTFVCDGCHSPGLDGTGAWIENGVIPDLRYMPAQAHKDWYTTVLGGTHWSKGMPGFSDPPKFAFPNMKMTVQDADALHAYVIDGSLLNENNPTRAQLVSMWTAPTHRQLGIGRLLVDAVLDWAGSRNLLALLLMVTSNNDPAIRFYERLGFTKTGRTEPYP